MKAMNPETLKERIPESEFNFQATLSSGPGGQNVNKLNTKVELRFNVRTSPYLTDDEKDTIFTRLKNRINAVGELIITSQSERTQLQNKNNAIRKFFNLLSKTLTEKPQRKPTTPTKKSVTKRLESKRKRSYIKKLRKENGASLNDE